MSSKTEIALSGSRKGRVILHLSALIHDHKVRWHWKGISRELRHA